MKKIDLLIDRLQTARKWTQSLLEDIDETTWYDMPGEGIGHVAWQVGHIAASQVSLIHVRCFERSFEDCLSEAFLKTFGKGSTPTAERSMYPAVSDIRASFERVQSESVELVGGLSESALDEPAGTAPHPLFRSKEGAILTAAMHETFHAGQLAMIRRLAGKPPLR